MRTGFLPVLLLFCCCAPKTDGQTTENDTDRVAAARDSIGARLEKAVLDFGAKAGSEIFLRAFKREKRLGIL